MTREHFRKYNIPLEPFKQRV